MKPTLLLFLSLLLVPCHLLLAAEGRPNIITVFIDDMGYSDFSCFGGTEKAK